MKTFNGNQRIFFLKENNQYTKLYKISYLLSVAIAIVGFPYGNLEWNYESLRSPLEDSQLNEIVMLKKQNIVSHNLVKEAFSLFRVYGYLLEKCCVKRVKNNSGLIHADSNP